MYRLMPAELAAQTAAMAKQLARNEVVSFYVAFCHNHTDGEGMREKKGNERVLQWCSYCTTICMQKAMLDICPF